MNQEWGEILQDFEHPLLFLGQDGKYHSNVVEKTDEEVFAFIFDLIPPYYPGYGVNHYEGKKYLTYFEMTKQDMKQRMREFKMMIDDDRKSNPFHGTLAFDLPRPTTRMRIMMLRTLNMEDRPTPFLDIDSMTPRDFQQLATDQSMWDMEYRHRRGLLRRVYKTDTSLEVNREQREKNETNQKKEKEKEEQEVDDAIDEQEEDEEMEWQKFCKGLREHWRQHHYNT